MNPLKERTIQRLDGIHHLCIFRRILYAYDPFTFRYLKGMDRIGVGNLLALQIPIFQFFIALENRVGLVQLDKGGIIFQSFLGSLHAIVESLLLFFKFFDFLAVLFFPLFLTQGLFDQNRILLRAYRVTYIRIRPRIAFVKCFLQRMQLIPHKLLVADSLIPAIERHTRSLPGCIIADFSQNLFRNVRRQQDILHFFSGVFSAGKFTLRIEYEIESIFSGQAPLR